MLTPRVDIKAIDIEATKKDVAALFKDTGFSRVPVYEDDLDKILGVLNQKDFHNFISGSRKTIADYVKPVVFVAGSIKCADQQIPDCHRRGRVRRDRGTGDDGGHHRGAGGRNL